MSKKETQKEQLIGMLEKLGATVTMEDVEAHGDKLFVITVKK